MPKQDTSYEYIKTKISAYKETYPSLKDKADNFLVIFCLLLESLHWFIWLYYLKN